MIHLPSRPAAVAAVVFAAVLAGCASKVSLDDKPPVESRTVGSGAQGSGSGGAATQTPQSQVTTVDLSKNDAQALAGVPRIVYFDFDSFVLKDEYRPAIEAYSKALSANRSRKMVVEGHTDERGGREYNLALGQKRAEAVTKAMVLLGVAQNQVEAVSFGKERPAVQGNDEASWAQNRRAELKDR